MDIARLWLRGPSEVFTIQVGRCLTWPSLMPSPRCSSAMFWVLPKPCSCCGHAGGHLRHVQAVSCCGQD